MFLYDYKISENKKLDIALRECLGFGITQSNRVIIKLGLNLRKNKKLINWPIYFKNDLDLRLENCISNMLRLYVGIDKKNIILVEMKNLKESFSYRVLRHWQKLPVRGQRTKNNAMTQKSKRGNRKRLPVAKKKKK